LRWGIRSKTIQAINLGKVLLKFSGIKNKRKCIIFSWVYFSVGTWLGLNKKKLRIPRCGSLLKKCGSLPGSGFFF
jgi:hypothetical protein